MSDRIYELVIEIDSNQFSQTDREAYIKFEDENFGFIAPVISGVAYLTIGDGLTQNGIPVDVLIDAFKYGKVYLFSSIYDPVGRTLYDAPLLIRYRTLADYDYVDDSNFYDSAWPYNYTNRYRWNYARGTIYGHHSVSHVPKKQFSNFPRYRTGGNRMRPSGSYGRYKMGNFSHSNRSNHVSQRSFSNRGSRRK